MFEAVLLQALIDGTGNSAVKAADLLRVIMESVTGELWSAKCKGAVVIRPHSFEDEGYLLDGSKADLLALIAATGPQDIHLIIHLERIFRRAFPEQD